MTNIIYGFYLQQGETYIHNPCFQKEKKQIKIPGIFEDSEPIKDQVSTMDLPIYQKIYCKQEDNTNAIRWTFCHEQLINQTLLILSLKINVLATNFVPCKFVHIKNSRIWSDFVLKCTNTMVEDCIDSEKFS